MFFYQFPVTFLHSFIVLQSFLIAGTVSYTHLLEIAEEIGVFDKVMEGGWRCLSAKESGRIGGLITKKKKQLKEESMKSLSM